MTTVTVGPLLLPPPLPWAWEAVPQGGQICPRLEERMAGGKGSDSLPSETGCLLILVFMLWDLCPTFL